MFVHLTFSGRSGLFQISFVTLAGSGIGGVDLQAATSITIPNLVVAVNSAWPIPEPSSAVGSYGIKLNISSTNKNIVGNLFVYGYYYGVIIGTHTNIGTLFAFANYYAIGMSTVVMCNVTVDTPALFVK